MKLNFIVMVLVYLFPFTLLADGFYLDAGIAIHSNTYDTNHYSEEQRGVYIKNPIGMIEAGHCKGGVCGFVHHSSSIPDKKDRGLTMIGIKLGFGSD